MGDHKSVMGYLDIFHRIQHSCVPVRDSIERFDSVENLETRQYGVNVYMTDSASSNV